MVTRWPVPPSKFLSSPGTKMATLLLGDYQDSDDDSVHEGQNSNGIASTEEKTEQSNFAAPTGSEFSVGKSFFNVDDADLSDSSNEASSESEEEPIARPKASALPPVRELLSAAPLRPEFLHRAAIYDVKELTTFDRRTAPEKPKPWLKVGPTPTGGLRQQEPAQSDAGAAAAAAGGEPTEAAEAEHQPRFSPFVAAQIMAAAKSMSDTYKSAPPEPVANGDDGPRPLIPMCELNSQKKRKESAPGKSFREKEKRKRDMGMQARDKSYVEEEKRVLRESMLPSFGQGFD